MLHDNLEVKNNRLYFAGVDAVELAEKYGTPLMVLDEQRIRERMRLYISAMKKYFTPNSFPLLASKALCFKRIYEIAKEEGMGTDIVSPGELYIANKAGFPMQKGFFHGNNKTNSDIAFAMDEGVGYFIADNKEELDEISVQAKKRGITQKILLRLTPGIDPHTHAKIATGKVDSKFGTAIETGQADEIIAYALGKENILLEGFHCHIGSQIFDIKPFCDAAGLMLKYLAHLKEKFSFVTKKLNLGGGMGVRYVEGDPQIDYEKNIKEISEHVKAGCASFGLDMPDIIMEPGRSIVADAGITLYTVGSVKEIRGYKNYVSIDGGMPDNPRYALYQSQYTVINASRASEKADYECTIAGRCCESGDLIGENVMLAKPTRGEVLAVLVTGAYNYSMASNYNKIPRPMILMVADKKEYVAVKRETYEDLIRLDV